MSFEWGQIVHELPHYDYLGHTDLGTVGGGGGGGGGVGVYPYLLFSSRMLFFFNQFFTIWEYNFFLLQYGCS